MYILLNESMIDRFFGGMDDECLKQVKALVEQGAVLNTLNGEIIINNIKTGIFTDFNFKKEF